MHPSTRLPFYLAGKATQSQEELAVLDKFSGKTIGSVYLAHPEHIQRALQSAEKAFPMLSGMPRYARREILLHCSAALRQKEEVLADVICSEVGKTIAEARTEVQRAADTFQTAAELCCHIEGAWLPLELSERSRGVEGILRRFPRGTSTFLTPFNFPLNLAAHKIAPAIAVGCPFILRPSRSTPVSAIYLGEILAETRLPEGSFSILPCSTETAAPLLEDPVIKVISFTGSAEVGWPLKEKAPRKHVVLELGGNAGCLVEPDADLDRCAEAIAQGAFAQAGQSCISVQRILVAEAIYETFRKKLVDQARLFIPGDPHHPDTRLGTLISEKDARRVEEWIQTSVTRGARLLCGGKRQGTTLEASLLENVPATEKLWCEEVFGPVAVLRSYGKLEEGLQLLNQSRFGLQAAIFTQRLDTIQRIYEKCEVGAVIVNQAPTFRVDSMPYGGVKESGDGREGVRYAMESLTEPKLLVIKNVID